ncbi:MULTISPECIES: SRPBCC family protein [unclassified Nocardioides]|jgi:uncharacterized protein YndB with AHSA1/START domain|uniref:SRPBCC family protein n=1 Tax=unclassified Nocardioides TaxID=2615069 RepID=UPI0007023F09|nr:MULTISPECIES: SRPBCC family protein [unclassified Nocardioides]KRC56675.1 polyketide cyclase [Nocardioides sp. Root79]KRC76886.1 polyketide cyclase [Nocardioides sp. Root240]
MTTPAPSLHAEIEVAAPPSTVWALVADVTRMAEWSPQVTSTRLAPATPDHAVGTRFTNRNAHGELTWTTHAEITRYDDGEALAFRVEENWTTWTFELVATAAGTRLRQRRDAPDGISPLSQELTEAFMGGQEAFTASQRAGMAQTLAAIKAAAEGTATS